MTGKDEKLLKRLLATFKTEALEHIQAIAAGLLQLEKSTDAQAQSAIIDVVFRAAHSLKGAARTVGAQDLEALCQPLESVFAALKRGLVQSTPELFDLLHRVVDALGKLLDFLEVAAPADAKPATSDLIRALQAAATRGRRSPAATSSARSETAAPVIDERRAAPDTIRVAAARLDAVLLQTEELLSARLAASVLAIELRRPEARTVEWRRRWMKLQPDLRKVRHALAGTNGASAGALPSWTRVLEFLGWNQEFVDSTQVELANLAKAADQDQRSLAAMVDNLLDEMTKLVVQPFATLLDVFPRFVRELSRQQGKAVEFTVRGEEIEIDRRILEQMKDPLIHLVRNCLDHGIEEPQKREREGKRAQATVTVEIAARDGSNVEMLLSDDGAGIDAGQVKASAVKLGLVSADAAASLSDREALLHIFQPGVSTSPIITDISGRGLGLAIVKEKVEKLGGAIQVESQRGKGTSFRITLPLTLARFRGVVVRVDGHAFVVPTQHVERVARVDRKLVKTVENRETTVLDGHTVALSRLGEVLELPRRAEAGGEPEIQPVVVLNSGNQRIAFIVDEIVNEQEVLVKTLGKQLAHVRNIAGATIVGAGKVVPILNVAELMQSAVRIGGTGRRSAPAVAAGVKRKAVLVAEDSITSRILMKNILEAAGYRVETAVDGVDAFTKLRAGDFDLVVSDVEMPRMDGFGLTTRVRADRKFAELPVILVTALESREDREHGIDVGANAYMVKSSFDQSNLLEIVGRLI